MDITKRCLGIAAAALTFAFVAVPVVCAQTATLSFNDGLGTPNVGSYTPGSSFTFAINLTFAPGGSVTNLDGISYWFQQQNPSSPFNFAVTLRDVTGSQFTDLQTTSITYPQSLTPANLKDLGALLPGSPVGAGSYFIANITVSISASALPGTYFIENTTTGGKTSVITDDLGDTFAIPQVTYEIDVVPEPATWVGGGMAFAALLFMQRRRLRRIANSRLTNQSV